MSEPGPLTPRGYERAVEALLSARFGIGIADVGEDHVAGCRRDGWTPEECVQWLETKYNLDRIDVGPYGGINA